MAGPPGSRSYASQRTFGRAEGNKRVQKAMQTSGRLNIALKVSISSADHGESRGRSRRDGFGALLCRLLNVLQRKMPGLCMGYPGLGAVMGMGYRITCMLGGRDITSFSFLLKLI